MDDGPPCEDIRNKDQETHLRKLGGEFSGLDGILGVFFCFFFKKIKIKNKK